VIEALKRLDGDPAREKLLSAINAFDLGDVMPSYGPDKNKGSDQVFFTIMQADGSFKPLVRLIKMAGQ
jgi:branched-chain amino acid transport system substrate-binding protein